MALSLAALTLTLLAATESAGSSAGAPALVSIFPAAVGPGFQTHESVYGVYRSAEDFLTNWPRASSCDDGCAQAVIAPVDFTRHMIIVIAPRGRGQETYDVAVTGVAERESTLDVTFLELRYGGPTTGEVLCGVLTTVPQPARAILVPQSPKRVQFFRRRADVICEKEVQVQ
jgi:hypothetical protein